MINQVFVTEQGLAYQPFDEWNFYLRRDGNFRFPKANEITWTPSPTIRLKAQNGVSYELGATRLTRKQKTQLSIYRLQLQNEIAFDPTQTEIEPMGSFRNFASTVRQGITLTETYNFTPHVQLSSQLNYVYARFASGIFSGNAIPAVPAFNGNINLQYALKENWRFKYSGLYTGASFAALDDANQGKKQSGYWINTITLQYLNTFFNVNFEIANLFNTRYASYIIYNARKQTFLYYPASGRSFLLTIKTNLDE